jgi:hypothetical protein
MMGTNFQGKFCRGWKYVTRHRVVPCIDQLLRVWRLSGGFESASSRLPAAIRSRRASSLRRQISCPMSIHTLASPPIPVQHRIQGIARGRFEIRPRNRVYRRLTVKLHIAYRTKETYTNHTECNGAACPRPEITRLQLMRFRMGASGHHRSA